MVVDESTSNLKVARSSFLNESLRNYESPQFHMIPTPKTDQQRCCQSQTRCVMKLPMALAPKIARGPQLLACHITSGYVLLVT